MGLQAAIILILGLIIIYDLLINVYTILFRISGLSSIKSKFQAISLLTNCGFTTSESEVVTSNKFRRNIAVAAMITGYVFSVAIVTLLINVILSFNKDEIKSSLIVIIIAFVIFVSLMVVLNLPSVKRFLNKIIEKLTYKFGILSTNENVITLLDLYGRSAMCEIQVNVVPTFMYGKTIVDSKIKDRYGISILILKRKNNVINITKDTMIEKGDNIVVFGLMHKIKEAFTLTHNERQVLRNKEESVLVTNEMQILDNYGKETMAEIKLNIVPEFLDGKTLGESGLKNNFKINIMMIKRDENSIMVSKDTVLRVNDVLIVLGIFQGIKEAFIDSVRDDFIE